MNTQNVILGLCCGAVLTSCSPQRSISSASPPKSAIVSYPNSFDRLGTTVISADPSIAIGGVNGRVMTISNYEYQKPVGNLLAIDASGNVGIHGSMSSVSSRAEKYDIQPYGNDPLNVLNHVRIVSFHYRGELPDHDRHMGFIAEETPAALSGSHHNEMNMNNTVALELAATQKLESKLQAMDRKVHALEEEVLRLRQRR